MAMEGLEELTGLPRTVNEKAANLYLVRDI